MANLQFPVELVLTDGSSIKLPPIKVKQERQIFKILGSLLNALPDEAVALVGDLFGGNSLEDGEVGSQDLMRLIQILLTELPDQSLEIAAILSGLSVEEAEDVLCYADVVNLIVMFINMTAGRFTYALSGDDKEVSENSTLGVDVADVATKVAARAES